MSIALPSKIRVACVQWAMRGVENADAFYAKLAKYVRMAADARAELVVLPELVSCELVSALAPGGDAAATIDALTAQTRRWRDALASLASERRLVLVGGSHLARDEAGVVRNVCWVADRDGTLHARRKIHATPNEREAWGVVGGDARDALPVPTALGRLGIAICYDVEFPELPRRLADAGVELIAVPLCTEDRHGYLRVRRCAQARAIENQQYLALAGATGVLPRVHNLDAHFAQSAVFTPCDHGFAREGIAVEATENAEQVVLAEIDLVALREARVRGTVRNLADRRGDLYGSGWSD